MTRTEAAWRLKEIAYEIYDKLDEMKDILREAAPEELERAEIYWMADINGALLNRKGWLGGSYVKLKDTLAALEEEEEEIGR